ncbi:MAG: carbamoyl phosphate synthase small subunit, partial [Opitutales bacterium]|nr:carbamoyl phosphate synthase small subunit [Opitutales bacterium]
AVDENSLANSDVVLAEVNVTDGAVAGIRHKSLPAFGVQYHPEDLTGEDFVFDEFYDLAKK